MSGYKRTTVSISPAEYKRLHDAEMKLRFMEKDLPELMNEFKEDKAANLQEDFSQLEKRQNDFCNLLDGLNDQIREIEEKTNQTLSDEQAEFWNSLQTVIEDNQKNYSQNLFEQTRTFNELIAEQLNAHRQEISNVSRSFQNINRQQSEKKQFAQDWISAAQTLCQFISDHFNAGLINPGQFDSLIARLDQAQQNLDYGLEEAALVIAQDVYTRCSELRIELEKKQSEREVLFSTARQQTRHLYHLATRSNSCSAMDIEGKELPVQIDVDFWTSGNLSKLVDQLTSYLAQFEHNNDQWTTKDLKAYIQETLPEIRSGLENAISQARLNVLSSQLRINIADVVVQALASQGFEVQQSLYSDNDMRKSFCARLGNLEGSEVIVKISPIQGEPGQNQLHLHSLDAAQHTEHELHQRALEISTALRQYGLHVSGSKDQTATLEADTSQQKNGRQLTKPASIRI